MSAHIHVGTLWVNQMRHARRAFVVAMLCILPAAAVELIELHGPDGQIVWLNPAEISTLRMPTRADLAQHFARGARCIVVMSNGKFAAVTEPCAGIRSLLH